MTVSSYLLWACCLLAALLWAPWRALRHSRIQHLFLGATVGLLGLWQLRAGVSPVLEFHFLATTAVTLMLGWRLAVVAGSLAALGLMVTGRLEPALLGVEVVLSVVVPATMTWAALRLSRRVLPGNPFVYIFAGAFAGGALAAVGSVLSRVALLGVSGMYPLDAMVSGYLPFLPLYALPEGVLNGMLVTVLVVYRPEWLLTFRAPVDSRHP